jgi:hypothetical protein
MIGHRARFAIRSAADADPLLRALSLLAQLGLTPLEVRWRRRRQHAALDIVQDGLEPDRAQIVAEKVRALVAVSAVELTLQTPPEDPA